MRLKLHVSRPPLSDRAAWPRHGRPGHSGRLPCHRQGDSIVSSRLTVLKIGGSVLRDADSYAEAGRFLHVRLTLNQDERLVVIVSAQYGTTDALEAEAQAIANDPSPIGLDLLWSTGELRSVALLALHLQKIGVSAVPFNVHQTGLVADRAAGTSVRPQRLRAALAHARLVIVPGFLGVSAGGA